MYCKYCGRALPENVACSCRAPGTAPDMAVVGRGYAPASPLQGPGYGTVPPALQGPVYYGAPVFYSTSAPTYLPVVALIKAHFSSKLMLALCIVASLGVPLFLLMQMIHYYSAEISGTAEFGIVYYTMGILPGMLIAVGLWIFYGACKSRTGLVLDSTGLRLVKIGYMVILIFHAFYLFLGAFSAFIFPVFGRSMMKTSIYQGSGLNFLNNQGTVALIIGIGFLLVLLGAFCIVSTVFAAKSVTSLMNICRFGSYDGKLSRFMIILIFVFAGITFFSVFVFGYQCAAAVLVQTAYLILFGLLLLKLRRTLRPFTPTYVMMQGGT